ncbi:MAG: serine/threonine protein kinase [Deltaproteobacteria bacterium]|nr:MAG: serine/threonine protein kinase [Deltaproteobacteria bacterium]
MVEHAAPRGPAVFALHAAVGARERERLDRQPVVDDERVAVERRLRAARRGRVQFAALVLRALDEQRRHRRGRPPAAPARHVVEQVAIRARRRQQVHAVEPGQVHAESARVLEKQFGMRPAGGDPARLLLVQVFREVATHRGYRTLHVRPTDQHGKVSHVGRVFLFKVNMQPIARHGARREQRPRPVHLALHHCEQRFAELVARHAHTLPRVRPPPTSTESTRDSQFVVAGTAEVLLDPARSGPHQCTVPVSSPDAAPIPLGKFLAPGMRLGKYQLIRQLAIGGMAEVYLARAQGIEGFQKRVVLKRILPQYATNPEFVSMFLDEARIAATLDHPNIVQVYDIGQQVGNYYFTMEYVQGQDVRNILKHEHRASRAVPLGNALTIVHGLCAGLHYAHDKRDLDGRPLGIVHRDVSLSNVLVSYDGAVKIADFGVAKCVAKQTQTRAGTLKGKIAYMSPEQCRGEPLDRRSDVFAAGIILYELTTGQRLFKGDSEFAILQQIATQDVPPPSTRVPGYPAALEAIVLKALRRDREARYQTAREMQRDIEVFARDHRLSISPIELSDYMRDIFADAIAAEPSDSGLSRDAALRAAPTVAATPRPRSLAEVQRDSDADDEEIVVVDACGPGDDSVVADAAGAPVYTAMFDAAPPARLADGSGEHDAVAERAAAAGDERARRPRRGVRAAVAVAIGAAAATVAWLALAGFPTGEPAAPAPAAPARATLPGATPAATPAIAAPATTAAPAIAAPAAAAPPAQAGAHPAASLRRGPNASGAPVAVQLAGEGTRAGGRAAPAAPSDASTTNSTSDDRGAGATGTTGDDHGDAGGATADRGERRASREAVRDDRPPAPATRPRARRPVRRRAASRATRARTDTPARRDDATWDPDSALPPSL